EASIKDGEDKKEKIHSDPEATPEEKTELDEKTQKALERLDAAWQEKNKKEERIRTEEKVDNAVKFTLDFIDSLPASARTKRDIWVKNSVIEALVKKNKDWKIKVEALDEEGKLAYSEKEGVPADGLIEILDRTIAEKNALIEAERERIDQAMTARLEQREQWIEAGDKNPDSWHQLKMSLHAVYNKLAKDDPLRAEIDALREEWLAADRKNQKNNDFTYNEEDFALQTGEAFRQVVIKKEEDLLKKINEIDAIIDQANVLEDNSLSYAAAHSKVAKDPLMMESRVKLEAWHISQGSRGEDRRAGKDLNDPAVKAEVMKGDYFQGKDEMEVRRELVMPATEVAPKGVLLLESGPIPKQITYNVPKQLTYRKEEEAKVLRIINIDEIVRGYAMRIADEKVRQMQHVPEEGLRSQSWAKSVFNNMYGVVRHPVDTARKTWLRLAENSYRSKFYIEALNQLTSNQNLMLEIETSYRLGRPAHVDDPNFKRELNYELLDKVIKEYEQGVAELEEKGDKISDPAVDTALKDLVFRHITEGWDRQRFENEQRTVINQLRTDGFLSDASFLGASGRQDSEVQGGLMYATNLFNIAEDYKAHVDDKFNELAGGRELTAEQKEKLAGHIRGAMKLDIELGAKFSDLHNKRPAGTLRRLERFVNWTQNTPILRRIASNPGSYAFAAALLADQGIKGLTRRAVKGASYVAGAATGALLPVLAAAGLGGTFAYARRSRDIKHDRAMHQNQRILGQKFDDHRRNQMERFQYDTRSVDELQKELDAIKQTAEYGALSAEQKGQLSAMYARFRVEYDRDLDYRVRGGQNRTVDLISVNREEGGKYGTNYLSKTDLKADLYKYLRANDLMPADRTGERREISSQALTEFNNLVMENYARLNGNIDDRDREFESHRRRSAAVMGAFAAIGAGAAAIGVQELARWWRGGSGYTAWDVLRGKDPSAGANIGKGLSEKIIQENYINGQKLNAGHNEIVLDSQKFDVVMGENGAIDEQASVLPPDWSVRNNALTHMAPRFGDSSTIDSSNFKEWAEGTFGEKLDRVSYVKHLYAETPPEKGIRALPEKLMNLFNNKKLNANLTELMMQYKQDSDGRVFVDVSKMLGKTLKAAKGESGNTIEGFLKGGKKIFLTFSLDNAKDGTQLTPIKVEIGPDLKAYIPDKLKEAFLGLDPNGKLLEGPQFHRGLHTLIVDTGETRARDGAHKVWEIASVYGGQKPEIISLKEEVFDVITEEKKIPIPEVPLEPVTAAPFSAAAAGVPRWQLESEVNEDKKPKKGKKDDKDRQPGKAGVTGKNLVSEQTAEKVKPAEDKKEKIKAGDKGAKEEAASEEKKTKAEEFYLPDKRVGEEVWGLNKHIFSPEGLRTILDKKNKWWPKILEKLKYYLENGEKKKVDPNQDSDLSYFEESYKRFSVDNPSVSLSFAEFNYCLKRGLEEFFNAKTSGPDLKFRRIHTKKQRASEPEKQSINL
ncbi:MAG: hypothetical protein MUC28_03050, partial [Planctomycetes bacterium]|nr:hypothetical protein [Planctomycetota bacterium]